MKKFLLFFLFLLPFCLPAQEEEPLPTDIFEGVEPKTLNLDEWRRQVGYPGLAVEFNIQGKVVVRMLVNKQGQYVKHVVLKDPHPVLTRGIEANLHKLKFSPGSQGGMPVNVWVTIPFDFQLPYSEPVLPAVEQSLNVSMAFKAGSGTEGSCPEAEKVQCQNCEDLEYLLAEGYFPRMKHAEEQYDLHLSVALDGTTTIEDADRPKGGKFEDKLAECIERLRWQNLPSCSKPTKVTLHLDLARLGR